MTTPETQPVTIAWRNPFKAPTVLLGENLITDASRVTIDCQPGGPPKIFLEFEDRPVEDLKLDGVIHVVKEAEPVDPLAIIVDFLSNVDGAELNRAVLEDDSLNDDGFGEVALKVLRGWARGD